MSLSFPVACPDCGRFTFRSEDRGRHGRCMDCIADAAANYDRDMSHAIHEDYYLADAFGARGGRGHHRKRRG